VYFVYRGKDRRWLGAVEAGSHPEAAGKAQLVYGSQADEGGLLVSVLAPSAFRTHGEGDPDPPSPRTEKRLLSHAASGESPSKSRTPSAVASRG
jgi:hypothetical protein